METGSYLADEADEGGHPGAKELATYWVGQGVGLGLSLFTGRGALRSGLRMVLSSLEAYGFKPDPHVVEAFSKYRKTHNDGVFDAYTAAIRKAR